MTAVSFLLKAVFASESVAHEIRHFLDEQKTKKLPAFSGR